MSKKSLLDLEEDGDLTGLGPSRLAKSINAPTRRQKPRGGAHTRFPQREGSRGKKNTRHPPFVTIEQYTKGLEAYLARPSQASVAAGAGVTTGLAVRLIEEAWPDYGMLPYKEQYNRIVNRITTLNEDTIVEEMARLFSQARRVREETWRIMVAALDDDLLKLLEKNGKISVNTFRAIYQIFESAATLQQRALAAGIKPPAETTALLEAAGDIVDIEAAVLGESPEQEDTDTNPVLQLSDDPNAVDGHA